MEVFQHVTPCLLLNSYRRFEDSTLLRKVATYNSARRQKTLTFIVTAARTSKLLFGISFFESYFFGMKGLFHFNIQHLQLWHPVGTSAVGQNREFIPL